MSPKRLEGLPGITVQRDGGEGQKVIIRGFEPKYNTISINGMMAPSTDLNNRSTDLNLISADIISGVEVNKANTADKDADGLGGNVNLVLREALPGNKLSLDVQTGYSSQTNTFGHYKGSASFSNRFFGNKLGLLLSGSAESYDRSADIWENDFSIEGNKNHLTSEDLESRVETRKRYNASLFMDFKTEHSVFKSSTFYSSLNRDYFTRTNDFDLGSKYLEYAQEDIDQTSTILSQAFEGKHSILNMTLDWGIGKSWSRQKQPYNHLVTFRQQSAFIGNPSLFDTIPPQNLPSPQYVDQQLDQMYLYDAYFFTFNSPESEFNAWLNLEVPVTIGTFLTGSLKGGVKMRSKYKEKDTKTWTQRFDNSAGVDSVYKYFPDIIPSEHLGYVGIRSFIDEDFDPEDYLNGMYSNVDLDIVLQRNMMKDLYDQVGRNYYVPAPIGHVRNDYKGHENVNSAFIMADLKIGNMITFHSRYPL